jgi:lipopolysaccharide export system permease protein
VIGASLTTFAAYWVCLIAGESLADRLVVPPFAAMWVANAVLLGAALVVWRGRGFGTSRGTESLALGG